MQKETNMVVASKMTCTIGLICHMKTLYYVNLVHHFGRFGTNQNRRGKYLFLGIQNEFKYIHMYIIQNIFFTR